MVRVNHDIFAISVWFRSNVPSYSFGPGLHWRLYGTCVLFFCVHTDDRNPDMLLCLVWGPATLFRNFGYMHLTVVFRQ